MDGLLLLGIFIAPPLLVAMLGKTKLWWVGSVLPFGFAIAALTQFEETSGEAAGALNSFGNFLLGVGALLLVGYGLLLLAVGAKRRTADRRQRQVEQPLPVAKLVTSRA